MAMGEDVQDREEGLEATLGYAVLLRTAGIAYVSFCCHWTGSKTVQRVVYGSRTALSTN